MLPLLHTFAILSTPEQFNLALWNFSFVTIIIIIQSTSCWWWFVCFSTLVIYYHHWVNPVVCFCPWCSVTAFNPRIEFHLKSTRRQRRYFIVWPIRSSTLTRLYRLYTTIRGRAQFGRRSRSKRSETNSHQRRSYEWTASESSTRALTTIVVVKRMWVIYEESDVYTGLICIIEILFGFCFCFSSAAAATEDDDDLIADFMLDLFDGG